MPSRPCTEYKWVVLGHPAQLDGHNGIWHGFNSCTERPYCAVGTGLLGLPLNYGTCGPIMEAPTPICAFVMAIRRVLCLWRYGAKIPRRSD